MLCLSNSMAGPSPLSSCPGTRRTHLDTFCSEFKMYGRLYMSVLICLVLFAFILSDPSPLRIFSAVLRRRFIVYMWALLC
ncbi:hypothetical protein BDN70DRAFT_288898 [Pholiota conissans]|uniref:Uncharacterized protein n=1 Tax=Pholiota conissans TaxID=109636 RepID=A0A9P5YVW1_9AGAR|nr:hypothetical protein BDN70DRAFT_288898 [Pholiota conissans]